MKRTLTKIYFIALFLSFFGLRAQDTLNTVSTHHFFASVQAGSTFLTNFKADNNVIPISSLYFSYIPKNSKIILSIGPSFSPVSYQSYFGIGINAKHFLGKKISTHNFVVEFGDRIAWNQGVFDNSQGLQTNRYNLNNLYMGLGYFAFLGKGNKFFWSVTGNISINTYTTLYESKASNAKGSGFSAYGGTSISQAVFFHAGMKLR